MVGPIRLILADDHILVREGLKSLIASMAEVEVVGEADDGREVLRLIDELRPDVALMDIAMPRLNGLDATARAVRQWPGTRIIILSMHSGQRYVVEAMRAGASGYLIKNCGIQELHDAIRTVAAGSSYLSPAVSDALTGAFMRVGESSELADCPLTHRQREILQLVAEGHSSREIAAELGLSPKTVESHRAEIMVRLNIHDVAGMVRYAIGIGLVGPEV